MITKWLAVTAIGASLAATAGWTAYVVRPPVVHTHVITRTVTRTAPAKVVTKWRTKTKIKRVVVASGYNAAETACIVNLWHSYGNLANGGLPGDSSVYQLDCPGVSINGLR